MNIGLPFYCDDKTNFFFKKMCFVLDLLAAGWKNFQFWHPLAQALVPGTWRAVREDPHAEDLDVLCVENPLIAPLFALLENLVLVDVDF